MSIWQDVLDAIGFVGNPVAAGQDVADALNIPGDITNWIKGIGGDIASGIEGGVVTLFHDLWSVIIGPLEIGAGVVLAIVILVYAFRDDLGSLTAIVARGAA